MHPCVCVCARGCWYLSLAVTMAFYLFQRRTGTSSTGCWPGTKINQQIFLQFYHPNGLLTTSFGRETHMLRGGLH